VNNGIGCCDASGELHYCSSSGTMHTKTCTGTDVCGWDSSNTYYGCVSPPATADPDTMYPLACP
jgi:hypothetical protein